MAARGVGQLRSLTVSLCRHSGSSRGARAFVEELLPRFREAFPGVEVTEQLRPGRHPYLSGEYVNGKTRVVGVKNADAASIRAAAERLGTSLGMRKAPQGRRSTRHPSVQGPWAAEAS
mmetsp:Transcript_2710/g.7462  ORF Transcript_2710/g.7462 Transcript_2710/m.7462 type:complete len:118 (+) Transcript_2710:1-354(+)